MHAWKSRNVFRSDNNKSCGNMPISQRNLVDIGRRLGYWVEDCEDAARIQAIVKMQSGCGEEAAGRLQGRRSLKIRCRVERWGKRWRDADCMDFYQLNPQIGLLVCFLILRCFRNLYVEAVDMDILMNGFLGFVRFVEVPFSWNIKFCGYLYYRQLLPH